MSYFPPVFEKVPSTARGRGFLGSEFLSLLHRRNTTLASYLNVVPPLVGRFQIPSVLYHHLHLLHQKGLAGFRLKDPPPPPPTQARKYAYMIRRRPPSPVLPAPTGLRDRQPEPEKILGKWLAGPRQDAVLLHLLAEDGRSPTDGGGGGGPRGGLRLGCHQTVRGGREAGRGGREK